MSSFRVRNKKPRSSFLAPVTQSTVMEANDDIDFWFGQLDQLQRKKTEPPAFRVSMTSTRKYRASLERLTNTNQRSCQSCRQELIRNAGLWTCPSCGLSTCVEFENDEKTRSFSMAYKRINHLAELLTQFQAKEGTVISDSVLAEIREELKKRRLIDTAGLNVRVIRCVLRELGHSKLYEHSHLILWRVADKPPPALTREQEQQIRRSFLATLRPFSLYCPRDRKNFLNYNFVIRKLAILHGIDHLVRHFPLLKSRSNLQEQESIWSKICAHNGWTYVSSI